VGSPPATIAHGASDAPRKFAIASIYEHRDEYIEVLRAVDRSQRIADAQSTDDSVVQPDFISMVDFLRRMLMKQFAAAIDQLGSPAHR
jgi:hypothetical protein